MTVVRALVLSLVVHMLIMLGIEWMPEVWVWNRSTPEIAEIEFIEVSPAKNQGPREKQVVRDATPPEKLKDENSTEEARFQSANRQRVLVETKSRHTGLTRNSSTPPLPHDSWLRKFAEQNGSNSDTKAREISMDGYERIPLPSPKEAQGFEGAPSTTGELLPDDISLGEFTALNTDRFKYYSFYARIEELVRFRWEQALERAIEYFPQNQGLTRDRWTTMVEFWLTPEGRFHSAHVHKESGYRRFDQAAVSAFREANYFPNPPVEMVEEDGFIRIQYSFTVRWSPTSLVRRR